MTIKELIAELQETPQKGRLVSIVVGNEDDNTTDTCYFEIHHKHDLEHPIELFVFES